MRRLMRLFGMAEYGWDELLLALLAGGLLSLTLRLTLGWPFAFVPLPLVGIVVWFFRDPNRSGDSDPATLLSPADGTVADLVEVEEPDFIGGKALRIGIFLSPLNVHVNRAPCDGAVRFVRFKSGEFLPAYNPQAPERNESASLGLQLEDGRKIMVKQITGVLARRIVCESREGTMLRRGERYGMIKFGSRTELYVPLAYAPQAAVKLGDKVRGGETVLCRWAAGIV
jgi:phosphatidylserine decarboxylase